MIGIKVTGLAVMGSVIGLTFLVACGGSLPTDPTEGGDGNNTTTEQDAKQGAPASGDQKKSTSSNDPKAPAGGTNGTNGADGKAGNNNPGGNNPGGNNPGGNNPGGGNPGGNGQDGQAGRVSVGEHCCFAGKYQRCPDANACFGGFDINACLQGCSPFDPCFNECFDKLDNAGAPKGCDANAQPPAGVNCATGEINI